MSATTDKQKTLALARAFVALKSFHENAFSPTMASIALRAAGNCLWALGVEHHSGIHAVAPEGETIDLVPQLQIARAELDGDSSG